MLKLFLAYNFGINIIENSIKIRPKWFLSSCVITVLPDGQIALVCKLIMYKSWKAQLRDVHINNAHFISAPSNKIQREN